MDRCTQPPGIAGSGAQSATRGGPVAAFLLGESWPLEAAGAEKVEVSQWHCHVSGALKFPDDVAEWKQ